MRQERDFFTEMMLGRRNVASHPIEEFNDENKEIAHRDWLLGRRDHHQSGELPLPEFLKNHPIGRMLENIDYAELMGHIDTLMTTSSELKPLFKKIKPLIETFLEKEK